MVAFRELPPKTTGADSDYALGLLAAEVAMLRKNDEKMAVNVDGLSQRLDLLEDSAAHARGAMKLASWLLGTVLTVLIGLAGWMVQTTIVSQERIYDLEQDVASLDANLELARGTLSGIREDLREIKTLQTEERTRAQARDEEAKRLLEGRRRR